ncbi:uncharacterized protein Tco025E_03038 [Trypanosoma conorhini]|uniref:Uncharacterized protein n=1 Tax=Trypanosoma conorhini TaxID=83891 RepID=A0A422PYS9_9TRYP|nr:uncharacterized protein Tco025E_03038 [Trypanosoma conorhini]RNF22901.1 hypothetical protein Tco025E_03038 [Trypanosoma conorhini]
MHGARPNIYVDVELRGGELPPGVAAIAAAVLVVLILLVVLVFFVCRSLLKAQYSQPERVLAEPTNTGRFPPSPPAYGNANLWRETFLGIVCDNEKYVHNSEALHAVYAVPLDLRLCDALVNEELLKDRDRLSRAWERRRALNDVFGASVHDVSGGASVAPSPSSRSGQDPCDPGGRAADAAFQDKI